MHKSKILFYRIKYFIFDRLLELRMNEYIRDKKIAKFLDRILIFMENQTTNDTEYSYEKVFGPSKKNNLVRKK